MEQWRAAAWAGYQALLTAPDEATRALIAAQIETEAANAAAVYAGVFSYQYAGTDSSARDAYCAENGWSRVSRRGPGARRRPHGTRAFW